MNKTDIYNTVTNVLVDILDIKPEDVKPESSLRDDLEADSLDSIEMIMALEEELDLEIGNELGEKITTVSDLVSQLEGLYVSE